MLYLAKPKVKSYRKQANIRNSRLHNIGTQIQWKEWRKKIYFISRKKISDSEASEILYNSAVIYQTPSYNMSIPCKGKMAFVQNIWNGWNSTQCLSSLTKLTMNHITVFTFPHIIFEVVKKQGLGSLDFLFHLLF